LRFFDRAVYLHDETGLGFLAAAAVGGSLPARLLM